MQTLIALGPEHNDLGLDHLVPCGPTPVNYEQPYNLPLVHQHTNFEVDRFGRATEEARLDSLAP